MGLKAQEENNMGLKAQEENNMDVKDRLEEIENWFTYHAPTDDQIHRYQKLREEAKRFAYLIIALTPTCADQSAVIRKLRECVMMANAAIACEENKVEVEVKVGML